MDLFKNK